MYPDPTSQSAALFERARRTVSDGLSRTTISMSPYPIYMREGSGARLKDVDGNEYIDFNNNYTSLIHGHAQPEVMAAVAEQLGKGTAFSFGHEAEVELAELLCGRVPAFDRIRFCNSGTEAVMNLIKAARAYTGRSRIAKCEGAYHGSYDYAEASLSSSPDNWGEIDAPNAVAYSKGTPQSVLDDMVVIPLNHLDEAEAIIRQHGDSLAGILVDPVPNRVGMIPAQPEFLAMLRRVSREIGALLLFDEVIAFRLGYQGCQTELDITADLTSLGKIIGGGFPVGAVTGQKEFMSVFEAGDGKAALPHGGTFNANPVTMVAGKAAMTLMDEPAYERLNAMGEKLRAMMKECFVQANMEGQVTGAGSLFKLHMHNRKLTDHRDAWMKPDEQQAMDHLNKFLLDGGIALSPTGMGCLSSAMEDDDLTQMSDRLLTALRRLKDEKY